MGRKNNVNPDHYKTAGRELPGQDIVQEIHKQKFTQAQENAGGSKYIPDSAPQSGEMPAEDPAKDTGQVKESANSSSNT